MVSLMDYAQQDPQASMYFFNPLQINPAYSGTRGTLNFVGVSRTQWAGWDGAPNTQFFSAHAPIVRKKIGLGFNMFHDKIGSRSSFNAMFNFAYHLQLNKHNLKLSSGLSAGFQQNQFGFTNLLASEISDPNYLQSYSSIKSNFGLGLYLHNEKFYAGLSMPRLLKRSLDNNHSNSFLQRHVYMAAGYVYKVNSVIDLKPSVLLKFTGNSPVSIDFNFSAHLFQQIWLGVLYRYNDAIGFNALYQIKDYVAFGYSYDFPINGKLYNQWGSHEFALLFDLKTRNNSFYSPRYF
jgi:type IX secretion system PorP/SprF family membrane protein